MSEIIVRIDGAYCIECDGGQIDTDPLRDAIRESLEERVYGSREYQPEPVDSQADFVKVTCLHCDAEFAVQGSVYKVVAHVEYELLPNGEVKINE